MLWLAKAKAWPFEFQGSKTGIFWKWRHSRRKLGNMFFLKTKTHLSLHPDRFLSGRLWTRFSLFLKNSLFQNNHIGSQLNLSFLEDCIPVSCFLQHQITWARSNEAICSLFLFSARWNHILSVSNLSFSLANKLLALSQAINTQSGGNHFCHN